MDIKEKETIRKILTEEIKKLFNEFNYTKEINEIDNNTIAKLFNDIKKYATDNSIMFNYYALIRNINLSFKSEGIDLLLDCYGRIKTEIVKTGYIPIDKKISCDRCDLKCTDNNIDINKELTYIKLDYLVKGKVNYMIKAYCPVGKPFIAVKQENVLNTRSNHTEECWANYIKTENEKCVKCGSEENLNAHHFVPVGINKRYQYDTRNGITLCEECHKIIHKMWKNIEPPQSIYQLTDLEFRQKERIKNIRKSRITSGDIIECMKRWDEVVSKISASIRVYVNNGIPTVVEDGVITLVFNNVFSYDAMCRKRHQAELRNAIISVVGRDIIVEMKLIQDNTMLSIVSKDVNFKIKFKE